MWKKKPIVMCNDDLTKRVIELHRRRMGRRRNRYDRGICTNGQSNRVTKGKHGGL